jgi:hypothetical protein
MNWADIEERFGPYPTGSVFRSAWWASRVLNYLNMQQSEYNMHKKNEEFLSSIFDYHNPVGIDPTRFSEIREAAKELGRVILKNGGDGQRDIAASIESIRLAVYYAIASIVLPKQ